MGGGAAMEEAMPRLEGSIWGGVMGPGGGSTLCVHPVPVRGAAAAGSTDAVLGCGGVRHRISLGSVLRCWRRYGGGRGEQCPPCRGSLGSRVGAAPPPILHGFSPRPSVRPRAPAAFIPPPPPPPPAPSSSSVASGLSLRRGLCSGSAPRINHQPVGEGPPPFPAPPAPPPQRYGRPGPLPLQEAGQSASGRPRR